MNEIAVMLFAVVYILMIDMIIPYARLFIIGLISQTRPSHKDIFNIIKVEFFWHRCLKSFAYPLISGLIVVGFLSNECYVAAAAFFSVPIVFVNLTMASRKQF
jgi:hypothetical protein